MNSVALPASAVDFNISWKSEGTVNTITGRGSLSIESDYSFWSSLLTIKLNSGGYVLAQQSIPKHKML